MTSDVLGYMADCMDKLSVPYEFMVWTQNYADTYAVGEYTEEESLNEDGCEKGVFLLTLTTTKKYFVLEKMRTQIKQFFSNEGKTAMLGNGSGVAVSYGTAFPVLTGEQGLYRMQINLNIKEWKGE